MNKSYYAIIPANVRYDKELTPNSKLIYGEITALCNEKGYCWASNSYFSELYEVSNKSVSKWINQLIEKKYISSKLIYKEGSKEIKERRLYIGNFPPMEEKFHTYGSNVHEPMEEKVKDNNTINNTDNIYIDNIWKLYPNKQGKASAYKKIPKIIKSIGYDKLVECIENYIKYVDIQRNNGFKTLKYLNGSTFFNGRYEDYLEEVKVETNTVKEEKKEVKYNPESNFNNISNVEDIRKRLGI